MANFPVTWQFLTAVDMDGLAPTPGRNAEHCCVPEVLLASGYLIQNSLCFAEQFPKCPLLRGCSSFPSGKLEALRSSDCLILSQGRGGVYMRFFLFIIFWTGHCSCVWSIRIGRSRPKGIWGMCQNKANSLSRTHIHSEASCIKTC